MGPRDFIVAYEFKVGRIISESFLDVGEMPLASTDDYGQTLDKDGKPFDDIYGDHFTYVPMVDDFIQRSVLEVFPLKRQVPVKELVFDGPTLFVPEDSIIKARMALYKKVFNPEKKGFAGISFVERDFKDIERALEIIVYNSKGDPFRVYRSRDYSSFFDDSLFKGSKYEDPLENL